MMKKLNNDTSRSNYLLSTTLEEAQAIVKAAQLPVDLQISEEVHDQELNRGLKVVDSGLMQLVQ